MASVTLFVIGTTVGGYGTLIGAGGGFLLIPVLLFVYPSAATGTLTSWSLAVVALNALSGTAAYARMRRIDYQMAAALSLATVPATMLGAAVSAHVPRYLFEPAFGTVLLALATFLLWRPVSQAAAVKDERDTAIPPAPATGRLGIGLPLSALVGFVAGLLGIGGSPLQVVVLTHAMNVSVHTAMPTSQLMVLLAAAAGVATHVWTGHFHIGLAPVALLGAGALVGAQAGALLSTRVSTGLLLRLLAVGLLAVGAKLLLAPLL